MIRLFFFLLVANAINAHEHWVTSHPARPIAGQPLTIEIGSGHHFPDSELGLGDAVIKFQKVFTPSSPEGLTFSTEKQEHFRSGAFVFEANEPHLFECAIGWPAEAKPKYRGRLLIGSGPIAQSFLLRKQGLEIVPASDMFEPRSGTSSSFQVYLDGEQVSSQGSLFLPNGKHRFIEVTPSTPISVPLDQDGTYCLMFHYKGKIASLVFHVIPV